jgi:hypothetical protein
MVYQIFSSTPFRSKRPSRFLLFDRAVLVFVRRLIRPFVLLLFVLRCVFTHMRLEHLRFADALFWTAHPHAIEFHQVHTGTKYFPFWWPWAFLRLRSGLRKESC